MLVVPFFLYFLSPSTTKGFGSDGWHAQLAWHCLCSWCAESVVPTASLSIKDWCGRLQNLLKMKSLPGLVRLISLLFAQVLCLALSRPHALFTLCDHSPLARTDDELQGVLTVGLGNPTLCLLNWSGSPASQFSHRSRDAVLNVWSLPVVRKKWWTLILGRSPWLEGGVKEDFVFPLHLCSNRSRSHC